jgi:hypothetical protein
MPIGISAPKPPWMRVPSSIHCSFVSACAGAAANSSAMTVNAILCIRATFVDL